jgi:hypothetical protein
MPPRPKSQKERRSKINVRAIPSLYIMPTPYSHCRTKNLVCRVDLKSGRYYECVRRAQKYSLRITKQEFNRLAKMRKQVEEELEKAKGKEEKIASKL